VQLPEAERVRASPLHALNQWPNSRPSFTAALKAYIAHMGSLGDAIMRGIAAGLNLQQDFFEREYRGLPYWVVRVIHYPPLPGAQAAGAAARALQGALLAGAVYSNKQICKRYVSKTCQYKMFQSSSSRLHDEPRLL
jgi:hypothetical protein